MKSARIALLLVCLVSVVLTPRSAAQDQGPAPNDGAVQDNDMEAALVRALAPSYGQPEALCGTVATPAMAAEVQRRIASGIYERPGSWSGTLTGTVPIAFHIVRTSFGSGGYAGDTFSLVNSVNQAFAGSGLSFCEQGTVDYINNSLLFTIDSLAEADQLRLLSVVPDAINVYFVDNMFVSGFQLAGLSSFTFSPGSQGIILDKDFTPYFGQPSTWPHEVGHYFDLFHTDEAFMTPPECTNGSNCAIAGDLVCDTPADPGLQGIVAPHPSCAYQGGFIPGPCPGDGPYVPDVRNYLGFAPQLCRDHLTPGQKARAFNTFVNLRPELQLGGCVHDPVELHAFTPAASDLFGSAVDVAEVNGINSAALVVGAKADDAAGLNSGSAFVFESISGTGWGEDEMLVPPGLVAGENLGASVAFDGFTAFLGAPEGNGARGAAYVYERHGQNWSYRQKLTLAGAAANARFGHAVDVHGDWAIVSASGDNGNQGSATIFQRNSTTGVWAAGPKFLSTDTLQSGGFASSVSLSGNTAAVGSYEAWTAGIGTSGAVFLYDLVGSTWSPTVRLTPPGLQFQDEFGASVVLFGDTLLAGAPGDDDLGFESGSAHVFVLTGSTWQHRQKLTAFDGALNNRFGTAVGLGGDTAVVGAPFANAAGPSSGAAYRFSRTAIGWISNGKILPAGLAASDEFGGAVAVEHRAEFLQDDIAIGAMRDSTAGSSAGAVHAYQAISNLPGLSLTADVPTISIAAGGSQQLACNATSAQAGKPYLVLGTFGATSPGIIVSAPVPKTTISFVSPHSSFVLPLTADKYFNLTLNNPGPPIFQSVGFLDAAGQATATFTWPAGYLPVLAGTVIHHAFVLPDDLFFSSGTTVLTLLP